MHPRGLLERGDRERERDSRAELGWNAWLDMQIS